MSRGQTDTSTITENKSFIQLKGNTPFKPGHHPPTAKLQKKIKVYKMITIYK